MKRKNLILTLAITLVIGLGTTIYAATNNESNNNISNCVATGIGRIAGFRGRDIITNILNNKGVTDSQITDSLNSGKTLHDIAEEKGITDVELKNSIVNEKTKIINDAVANGTITEEQGNAAKKKIQENVGNCPAGGRMKGRAGEMRKGSCKILYSDVKE